MAKKDQEAVKQESMEGDTMQETHDDDNSPLSVQELGALRYELPHQR